LPPFQYRLTGHAMPHRSETGPRWCRVVSSALAVTPLWC
jgi:hypothetical protein